MKRILNRLLIVSTFLVTFGVAALWARFNGVLAGDM
jgi:hypothetical protein